MADFFWVAVTAFVQLQHDFAVHLFRQRFGRSLQRAAQRREPAAVVHHIGHLQPSCSRHLKLSRSSTSCSTARSAATMMVPRGFITAAGFDAHRAVFHDVDTANAVLGTQRVQGFRALVRRQRFTVNRNNATFLNGNGHLLRLIRRFLWIDGPYPAIFVRRIPRAFQHAAFGGDVPAFSSRL